MNLVLPTKAHMWWQDVKAFFAGQSQNLSISLSQASRVSPPTPTNPPEMVELSPISGVSSGPLNAKATRPPPSGPHYHIPDLINYSPYQLNVNPHYQPAAAISEQWIDEHGVHESDRKRQAYEACNFGLLTAMCYSEANFERFRVLCDFINCLFCFDDLTDEGGLRKDERGTRKASDIVMNSLFHPFTYDTEFKCGKVFME